MKVYTIKGNPTSLARMSWKNDERHATKLTQSTITLHLEAQHDEAPKYRGKLHLDVTFYIHTPHTFGANREKHENKPCVASPCLHELLSLIEKAIAPILFDDVAHICSITTKKVYSLDPRMEFSVKEVL